METIFEILKVILPAIIAGLFTFFITKYTYNKNMPIDKLEISYNRIYYPLYKKINDRNDTEYEEYKIYLNSVLKDASYRFKKYNKYVDRATLKSFYLILNSKTQTKKELNFYNFKDNIISMNNYLRRRLGYLEPGLFQIYKYSSHFDKFVYRISIEFLSLMIFAFISCVVMGMLQIVSITIVSVIMVIMLLELSIRFCMVVGFKIIEIIEIIKKCR